MAKRSSYLISDVFKSRVMILKRAQAYYFGRSPENDIVLPSDHVSRKHAKLVAGEEGFLIADLGSRNGTRVNAEPVPREGVYLTDGDTINIGPFALRYREKEGDLSDLIGEAGGERTQEAQLGGLKLGVAGQGLAGAFDGLGLIEICQFIAQGSKDGVLVVESGMKRGRLVFSKGLVVLAEGEGASILERTRFVIGMKEGRFEFQNGLPDGIGSDGTNEPLPVMPILVDLTREHDEMRTLGVEAGPETLLRRRGGPENE